jgi:hypothetical protein
MKHILLTCCAIFFGFNTYLSPVYAENKSQPNLVLDQHFSQQEFEPKVRELLTQNNGNIEKVVEAILLQNKSASYYKRTVAPHNDIQRRIGKKYRTLMGTYLISVTIQEHQSEVFQEPISIRAIKKRVSGKKFVIEKDRFKLNETRNWYDINDRLWYLIKLYKHDFKKIHATIKRDNPNIQYLTKTYHEQGGVSVHAYHVSSGLIFPRNYVVSITEKDGKIIEGWASDAGRMLM